MSPADRESSYGAIERLIATYAELVDDGDFAAVGRLMADATFTGGTGVVTGGDAIENMLRDNVIVYEDGTPRTKRPISRSRLTKMSAPLCRVRTSPRCRRCLA